MASPSCGKLPDIDSRQANLLALLLFGLPLIVLACVTFWMSGWTAELQLAGVIGTTAVALGMVIGLSRDAGGNAEKKYRRLDETEEV